MYNGFQVAGEASNNPFLNDSTPAHARFPDISASTLSTPQAGYQSYDPGYQQQSQLQHQHSQFQQQQYPQFQGQAPYSQPQQFQQNQYASTSYSPGYADLQYTVLRADATISHQATRPTTHRDAISAIRSFRTAASSRFPATLSAILQRVSEPVQSAAATVRRLPSCLPTSTANSELPLRV